MFLDRHFSFLIGSDDGVSHETKLIF